MLVALALSVSVRAQSSQVAKLYQEAKDRETELRKQLDPSPPSGAAAADLLKRMRTLSKTYEDLWRLFPPNGYSDNALWQGAMLSADAFWQFGESSDRARAIRLFQALTANFPASSLVKQVPPEVTRLEVARVPVAAPPKPAVTTTASPAATTGPVTLTAIRREVLPDTLRVTLELEHEPEFHAERIDGPPRVFIDLKNTRAAEELKDATLTYSDDLVRQVRVGRQLGGRIRVVLDLSFTAGHYSVYSLYNPYRIVIDFERKRTAAPPSTAPAPPPVAPATPRVQAASNTVVETAMPPATPVEIPPAPAAANSTGSFSLSRQLGLGISRIVIDAGHGGHDPGAKARGLDEADLTLDIALRLEKLFKKQSNIEVVLTRRDDTFIPLQERTAIANRAGADLFLSIHANASENSALRGIETYFLNLSPNPEAQRIAARENASSSKTMHEVTDIVKAIALNDKLDESRDFAAAIQTSMYEKLRSSNNKTRNLGVKQAPFMVLVGATMPSILAEISFITNRAEGALLKTEKYRQQIAEALYQGVMRYQQSLKKAPAVAQNTAAR
ncbi:MAG TPA: N-acetylmuramoyl-L-alanine amidase [Vicinamibacterales bacterium]|nr:N-acetylmuramoyl-L-alanine amidase [Vicinamibacterales bacterium]